LLESRTPDGVDLGDRALIAVAVFREWGAGVVLARCEHGRTLAGLGFSADLDYCGRLDAVGTVGALENGEIRAVR
jgi:phosphosulfolactate phosphohydrolase-like enzyme